ncbi:DUF2326 domain-containing protein, partial [Campylobacter upsaliensis]|nr:DUF2326 domain-containing protein [Campylobacter upsaliensis]EAJ8910256.1 DUF2326 domain-containing protein [Campylobacter upsaliensis]EGN5707514.1 DUF2326 domain-containing protein [Campylobacter upsaliensis]
MFLESLIIKDVFGNNIRSVKFNPNGLNLIVGIPDKDGSTNNIGKTTLIRCIDFCLGGKIEQLYKDKEFKTINDDIFSFLIKKQPYFEIILSNSIQKNIKYKILRKIIYKHERKDFSIEDQIWSNDTLIEGDFKQKLKEILFNNQDEKPTLRQLIPKFIRKDDQQINNVLRFVHQTTPNAIYEKIHLFLFDFKAKNLLLLKGELEHKLNHKIGIKKALTSRFNIIDLKQILEINKKELEKLYQQRDNFQIDDKYELEEKELEEIHLKLMEVKNNIFNNNLKKSILTKQLNELCDNIFDSDMQSLKLLYDEANFYLDNLHKSFNETVAFHNKMITNEINYLNNRLDKIETDTTQLLCEKNILYKQYSDLLEKLSKTGSLAEYTKLNEQIEKLIEEKGKNESLLNELEQVEKEINDINTKLSEIKEEINKNLYDFDNKLAIFNESFSRYSKILYDSDFFLSYDVEKDPICFYTKNVTGNEGSGKKQATISAFDLAYIDFINKANLNYPHFVAYDKIEVIDIERIDKLFEISNNINGQFIVPIIYD